jgi:hypothetical protein
MLIFPAMRATDPIRRRRPIHRRKFFSNIHREAMRSDAILVQLVHSAPINLA